MLPLSAMARGAGIHAGSTSPSQRAHLAGTLKNRASFWRSFEALCVSHSQTTSTRHPRRRSSLILRRSRSNVRWNFAVQYGAFDLGMFASPQLCRCQKQPCTNTTTRCRGNTTSGRPGRACACSRKRRPSAWAAERTRSSGDVFLLLIIAMRRLRA